MKISPTRTTKPLPTDHWAHRFNKHDGFSKFALYFTGLAPLTISCTSLSILYYLTAHNQKLSPTERQRVMMQALVNELVFVLLCVPSFFAASTLIGWQLARSGAAQVIGRTNVQLIKQVVGISIEILFGGFLRPFLTAYVVDPATTANPQNLAKLEKSATDSNKLNS